MNLKKILKNFSLTFFVLLLLIAFFEILLRTTNPVELSLFVKHPFGNVAFSPHPYLGYVYTGSIANNFGFNTNVNFPYQKRENEIVIGILGGSLAQQVGVSSSFWQEAWQESIKNKGGRDTNKRLVIINFAIAGYKQPQQFIAASLYADFVDVFITIDGFNEIYLPDQFSSINPRLPINKTEFYEIAALKDTPARGGVLVALSILQQGFRTFAKDSFFYTLKLNQWLFIKLKQLIYFVERSIEHSLVRDSIGAKQRGDAISLKGLSNIWKEYTWMQYLVLQAKGKQAYFFLQPNQHIKHSKELSLVERNLLQTDVSINREQINQGYSLLKENVKKLRGKGVPVFDLTMIFKDTRATVYIDGCCHLNLIGIKLVIENVLQNISENKQFRLLLE